ncbi:MAG: NUDIX domain-containing protein [Ahrensia sp.]|nr:NUDIX domain-containing protein [Ahrensia sp.]
MLDEALFLEPYEEPRGDTRHMHKVAIPANEPKILIPAIAADGSLYPIEKIEAHRRGVHHLAISVFVFDGAALLIQQRAKGKYHCGGQWANTCCTHPHWGEDAAAAAARRVPEELGFELRVEERHIVEYSADVGNGLWEKERVHMYRAEAARTRLAIVPNPAEVEATRWITADELRADMRANPHDYTPWFRIYVNRFPDLAF